MFIAIFYYSGLDWNIQFNIESILTKAGIEPGEAYTGDEIMTRLIEALGKKPGTPNKFKYNKTSFKDRLCRVI